MDTANQPLDNFPQLKLSPAGNAGPGVLNKRIVLIGTCTTIRALIGQVREERGLRTPVGCVLLDSISPLPEFILGTQVLGGLRELTLLHQVQPLTLAIISLPRSGTAGRRALSVCNELNITVREVPTLSDCIAQAPQRTAHSLNLSDLIGRTPHGIDRRAVARTIEHKRILVTGAGGSIGSEICRIAATFAPSELIFVERSENALFEIDRTIARRYPHITRRAVLHDCVDAAGTTALMARTRPHAVFHAAAHKHVPLMEDHPSAAIHNNVMGTKSVADAALACGVERFVMISSDKAVNPTSIMGATKRLAEMYLQGLAARPGPTSICMVRFGNVLGSACSVLPIWSSQLAEGGPLTVTDARMTRYFMTIHEAAALVIQSGAIEAPGAPIYVLDMGEPLEILQLARRFALLHGFEPIVLSGSEHKLTPEHKQPASEMPILITGARKGEKLHEELAYAAESLAPTAYSGITTLTSQCSGISAACGDHPESMISRLLEAAAQEPGRAAACIRALVPEMRTPLAVAA